MQIEHCLVLKKKNFKLDIDAARTLEINEEKLNESLSRAASRKERGALEEGIFRPYDISRERYMERLQKMLKD